MSITGPHFMSSAIDLESGQDAQAAPLSSRPESLIDHAEGLAGSDSAQPAREVQQVVEQAETLHEASCSACGCIPSGVFRPFTSIRGGRNTDLSHRNVGDHSTRTGQGSSQAGAQIPVASHPTFDSGPPNTTSESEEPRMIGDFDGTASEFWKHFKNEANSHDDARINTLKEGMDSALIFAGLFSAALTAFVVDSKQNLKPSPADETVYYLRQHSTILSQISVQLSSIAPQVAIPPNPPPPFPSFSPLASDVRVNVFWFMALAFSLLAALLAILVQQWVRKYMHVFKRYGDNLKSSRVRQYLYEGCEKWNMPKVAEVVPGFLHVSLFLFFAGLGNSLLNINTKVALSTIVPIGISGLLYIFITFAPIIYPQTPYQNSFSGIFWYLFQKQKIRGRRQFRDRGPDGEIKPVSANMAQGQMQLAMEETEARKGRDERAIRWLIDNLTEDAEMETFLPAIPGSFNTDWGTEVWKRVGKHHESEDERQDEPHRDAPAHEPSSWSIHSVLRPIIHLVRKPAPRHPPTHETTRSHVPHSPDVHLHSTTVHIRGEDVVHELSTRVARSVAICKNRGLFSNNDSLWRKRTRACVEATASLVFCANAKLDWFGDISKLLGDIGSFEKIQALAGTDELFGMRWTCLSLLAIRPILADSPSVHLMTEETMRAFAEIEGGTGNDDALAMATAQKINETLLKADGCLFGLHFALCLTKDKTEEEGKEILRGNESQISELEQINIEADRLFTADSWMSNLQYSINHDSHQIISQFPGLLDFEPALVPFSRLLELSRDPRGLRFIRPGQILKGMCSTALTLRNILEGQGDANAYKELLKNIEMSPFMDRWQGDEMQRQLWRLQDLRDGRGFGFTVELFFLAVEQLSSTSPSKEPHSALYTGTFRAITSDWSMHRHLPGTQNLLLDIVMSCAEKFVDDYPAYIVDEFLLLLGNVFEGQTGPQIDKARLQFEFFRVDGSSRRFRFKERVLRVFT